MSVRICIHGHSLLLTDKPGENNVNTAKTTLHYIIFHHHLQGCKTLSVTFRIS